MIWHHGVRFRLQAGLAILLLLLSVLGAIAPAGVWAQSTDTVLPRGELGLTGVMPGAGPEDEPEEVWQFETDSSIVEGMAAQDDTLFIATRDDGHLFALDLESGDEEWTVDFEDETSVFGPALSEELVIVSIWQESGGAVIAYETDSGDEGWRVDLPTWPTAPSVVDDVVYLAAGYREGEPSAVLALEAESGDEIWTHEIPDTLNLGDAVAVVDGMVFTSAWALDGEPAGLYALDAETGEEIWTFAETNELTTDPLANDETVIIVDVPRVWALDRETGEQRWEASGKSVGGSAAMTDDTVYISFEDEVRAFASDDGEDLWSAEIPGVPGPPVIADGVLYVAAWRRSGDFDPHTLAAFDAESGDELWITDLEYTASANKPIVVDDLLILDTDFSIIAYRSED